MGDHNLTEAEAVDAVRRALYERQQKLGEFQKGEHIVLEKEENGRWHCYYGCFGDEEDKGKPLPIYEFSSPNPKRLYQELIEDKPPLLNMVEITTIMKDCWTNSIPLGGTNLEKYANLSKALCFEVIQAQREADIKWYEGEDNNR